MIANVLAKLKYIEELGEGWDKIIDEYKSHPLNPEMPKIEATAKSMLVTLFSTKEQFEQQNKQVVTDRQRQIIEFLKNNDRITTSICAKLLDISTDTALRELSTLCSRGIIRRKGVGRGTYYLLS